MAETAKLTLNPNALLSKDCKYTETVLSEAISVSSHIWVETSHKTTVLLSFNSYFGSL